eukprot:6473993-Amphidinium_carterae.1
MASPLITLSGTPSDDVAALPRLDVGIRRERHCEIVALGNCCIALGVCVCVCASPKIGSEACVPPTSSIGPLFPLFPAVSSYWYSSPLSASRAKSPQSMKYEALWMRCSGATTLWKDSQARSQRCDLSHLTFRDCAGSIQG